MAKGRRYRSPGDRPVFWYKGDQRLDRGRDVTITVLP